MIENTQAPPSNTLLTGSADTLKRLTMHGAIWTFSGYGIITLLRFLGRLILARFLVPELFGLMTFVNVFLSGLELFSDIGINPSIIQNKRGVERDFLNTAWTIQVIRGAILWIVALLLAIPIANWNNAPILQLVIPVAGLTALIAGFKSTRMALANRRLQMRELTLIEVGSTIAGILVMVIWARLSPSIWALVAGGLVTMSSTTILSHIVFPDENHNFHWDSEIVREIYLFGRWIFVSTALTFLATQSDRLILGKLISFTFVGIYGNAYYLSRLVDLAIRQMGYKVMLPSYSELARKLPEELYPMLRQARLVLISLTWAGALIFIIFGPTLIGFLFPIEFIDGGWMLRIMAMGTLVGVLSMTYDNVLVARGNTYVLAVLNGIQFILQMGLMLSGVYFGGEVGVIIGLAAVGWLIYPFKAVWLSRLGLWQPEVDLPVIGLATLVVGTVYFIGF